jgi:hypothetical protein
MKEITWMWNFIQKRPDEVISTRRKMRLNDIRLEDIRQIDGNPNPTNEDKLFRGVAQRSLALQFSAFQSGMSEKSRCRRQGLIPTFVRSHLDVTNTGFAQQCIQAGQKQLRTEQALRKATGKEENLLAGTGISALTALTITPFKNLRIGQIPSFIQNLLSDSAKINLAAPGGSGNRAFHVLEALEQISEWFNDFQRSYDGVPPPPV